jgi:bifunctional non-homologous end joining protein LigD
MATRKLSLYQAKRDFTKTAEPSGKALVKPARYLRFVIQKHAASRLHYDLRLEVDGVFKSWAVAKGPSLNPRDRRLAIEVEDHPLDYGDFEGTIPQGEYGGGTVMLWDRGFWVPEDGGNPGQALRKGELKFTLAGEKLKGSWVLVRMRQDRERNRSSRNNWLLIKHRDAYARENGDAVREEDRSVASGRTMEKIEAGEGPRPKAFIVSGKAAASDAVWHSNGKASKTSSLTAVKRPSTTATGDHMVRQAAFKGLRQDRPASEVRADHAVPPEQLAATAPAKLKSRAVVRSKPQGNVVRGIVISNPDKLLWPAEGKSAGYSKIDLAHYLEEVGPWMIEHLKGRPCSLIRTPDGISSERFFQRHAMRGMSNLISLVTVEGDRKPYTQIDSVEGLIAAAQIAAVEYHPWNNQPGHPEIPGRLVFDLDPAPDVKFEAVIEAARELKARLEKLGLEPFGKTTGGKGMHVVTPLRDDDGLGWKEAKAFAQAVCSQMANDSPDRYLVVMTKKLRKGRIFLDYLRNDRTATAVAPLSPRARPGASVSMPLNWNQVKAGLDPRRFTMRTAVALLKRSKPWEDYCKRERDLKDAIERLGRS